MEFELERIGLNREERIILISSPNPVYAYTNESIKEVSKKISDSLHRSLPIVDKKMNLKGIITISDILNAFLKKEDFSNKIETIMSREVVFCEANERIGYVLQKMKISKRGRLPVISANKLVGMISESDFIREAKSFEPFKDIEIENVMTKKPFFVQPTFSIFETLRIMVNGKYRRLPVVSNKKLVGYITSTHLFRQLYINDFSLDFLNKKIETIMTKNPITMSLNTKLSEALILMKEKNISSLLIVNSNNELEGIFTERDFINLIY
ncbi:MAG: CBS domain-containing protein [Candidatus Aenigmatarchaeota archaeon]